MEMFTKVLREEKDESSASSRWSKDDESFYKTLLSMSKKHQLNPYQLRNAFDLASQKGVFHYADLSIECREINQEYAIFLITNNESIISQFPIKLQSLKNVVSRCAFYKDKPEIKLDVRTLR